MPVRERVIKCTSCDIEVRTIRTTTKFCSDKCRLRAKKIKVNGRKNCKRCGRSIKGLQNVDHCSDVCKKRYSLSTRKVRLVVNNCIQCGRSKLSRRKSILCSDECREGHGKRRSKEWYKKNADRILRGLHDRKEKYSRKCKECARFFETTGEKRLFCSNKCSRKFNYRKKDVIRRDRIIANGGVDWSISIERLTKRDGKVCYLCNEYMNYKVDFNHRDYPSIEVVVFIFGNPSVVTRTNFRLPSRLVRFNVS